MNWEALGAVAELIGAVGVIASLFYLAHQIRRSSSALEAATNQAIANAAQERLVAVAQSPDLAEAFAKAVFSREALSKRERVQFEFFVRATFRGLENAYVQRREGLISEESWRAQEGLLRNFLRVPHVVRWWPTDRIQYERAFVEYVDRTLSEELVVQQAVAADARPHDPDAPS